MYDSVIADVGSDIGEWYGIYGDPYSDLGVDMFGDLGLDDLPTPGPRAAVPTSANVVVQAVAQKVQNGQLQNPEKPLTKAKPVVRSGTMPRATAQPKINKQKALKLGAVVLGSILLWEIFRKK